jgi:hypothetical protein
MATGTRAPSELVRCHTDGGRRFARSDREGAERSHGLDCPCHAPRAQAGSPVVLQPFLAAPVWRHFAAVTAVHSHDVAHFEEAFPVVSQQTPEM